MTTRVESPVAVPGPRLGGLPQFIRYASTYPDPSDLMSALRAGPLAAHGTLACFLWLLVDGTHLVSIGSVGWSRDMVDRYSIIPLELDLPAVTCVLEDRITIDPVDGFGDTYLNALDDAFLAERFDDLGVTSIVNTPIRHGGAVIGALGFVSSEPWPDNEEGAALLSSVGAILGLWATHPASAAMDLSGQVAQREWSLAFTDRQKEVLALVGEGLSNTDIARRLLVSNSSVKQDLQHTMRALRTHSRQSAYERAITLNLLGYRRLLD